jgi:hypothetical protein
MSRYTIPPSLSKEKVYGPFFFMEKTITGIEVKLDVFCYILTLQNIVCVL